MDKAVIGLDVDGVILDYVSGFFRFMEINGHKAHCKAHEADDWTMKRAFPYLEVDAIWQMIERFSEDEGFATLKPFDGAVETIKALIEEFPDNPLVAITSAGHSPKTREFRIRNLSWIPFSEVHVLPLGESKVEHFKRLPVGSLYVDDLKKNVDHAESVGVAGVLVRRAYNRDDNHHRVAHDWSDIASHIREIIRKNVEHNVERAFSL